MSLDTDVLILGGGCAGLSLATALAARAPHLRVHVLEARERYVRDRTWCLWNAEPHPFSAGVTHRWSSWRLRRAGFEARQTSARYTYDHLPADCFYQLATAAMARAGHTLSMGIDVQAVREDVDGCAVETAKGRLRARWIFDSRPRARAQAGPFAPAAPLPAEPHSAEPLLVQRFFGWHVRTTNACFDPSVVDLMDFQPHAGPGAAPARTTFFYVLPFSPTEALVEATFLDDPALAPANAEAALRQYLDRLGAGAYEVHYTEAGALPMGGNGERRAANGSHLVAIGTRGGRVKPSSGYAFLRIQRQSAALARALATGAPLPATFEPAAYSLLDTIFLRALRRAPERAPAYFMTMFGRVPPDTLVRFLSETAGPGEILRVMLALPRLDFLQAALLPAKVLPA